MRYLLVFLAFVVLAGPVFGDEVNQGPEVTTGVFAEGATGRFDYTQVYTVIQAKLESTPIRLQLDRFDNPPDYHRLWLNAGEFELVHGKDFTASFQPSVIIDDRGRSWWGGFVSLAAPKVKLWLVQKSYIPGLGNPTGKHITFAGWQPTKHLGVMYYRYAERGYSPDSYIGPIIGSSRLYGWAGISTNRRGAWAVNLQGTIKF